MQRMRAMTTAGQTMVEFVSMVAMTLLTIIVLALLLYTFKEYGARVMELVGSEYP
jgi:Tfp pilus assembly protein PilV